MKKWTKEKVVREIKRIYKRKTFPAYAFMEKNKSELLNAGLVLFGTWEDALVAAEIICPRIDRDAYFDHELCVWAHDSLTEPLNRLNRVRFV